MLRYQNDRGMTLSLRRSEAIHCDEEPRKEERLSTSPTIVNRWMFAISPFHHVCSMPMTVSASLFLGDFVPERASPQPAHAEAVPHPAQHPVPDPVLAWPSVRGRCCTGSSQTLHPSIRSSVGRNLCMPRNAGMRRSGSLR